MSGKIKYIVYSCVATIFALFYRYFLKEKTINTIFIKKKEKNWQFSFSRCIKDI